LATADLLVELEDADATDVGETPSAKFLADVLDAIGLAQAADVVGDLNPASAAELLADTQDADQGSPRLKHPDESTGGWLIDPSFAGVILRQL